MIAALYVEAGGVYFGLPDVDPWDVTRDAKNYAGPHRVIAHPPCGPWGMMRGLCTKQDPSCGPRAIEQVRRFGGVLEHPAQSLLFRHVGAPHPGELPDAFGGRTFEIDQLAWGHPCRKRTWLYVVGTPSSVVAAGFRTGGTATHRVTSGPRCEALPSAHAKMRSATPPAFRDYLIAIANG